MMLLAALLLVLWALVRAIFEACAELYGYVSAERQESPYRRHLRELAEREPERRAWLARAPHRGRPAPRALPRPPARLRLPRG